LQERNFRLHREIFSIMEGLTRKTLRIAITGCAAGRVRYGAALAASSQIVVTALADEDETAARVWAREIGGRLPVFADLPSLLAAPLELDAVLVASSLPERTADITRAAHAGKAILCEVPLASTLMETDAVLRMAAENGVLLMPAMPLRLDSPLGEITRQADAGTLGPLRQARCEWSFPRNSAQSPESIRLLLEYVGCQAADVCRRWLGDAVSVSADMVLPTETRPREEALATILTTHEHGQSTLRLASTSSPQASERYTLLGANANLELVSGTGVALSAPQLTRHRPDRGPEVLPYLTSEDDLPVAVARRFRLLHHFAECVHTGCAPHVHASDARAAQEIFTAALLSTSEGTKISLPLRSSSLLSLPPAPGSRVRRALPPTG
jgi:myo-inositol 2-dehydrogenase / D-chiro-inositol 1-dehydrogenase